MQQQDISQNATNSSLTVNSNQDQLRPHGNLCPPESTLWMGDMNPAWTVDFIKNAFGKFSIEVRNVKLVTEKGSGKPASYCFVEFNNEEEARNAMLMVNGRSVPSDPEKHRFHLSFANSPEPHMEYNLFVNNLHPSVDDVALFKLFGEKYKSCRGAKVYRNIDGSSKESGFIRFMSETDQQMALVEMNKQRIKGKEIFLKLAHPKQRNLGPKGVRSTHNYGHRQNMPYSVVSIPGLGYGVPVQQFPGGPQFIVPQTQFIQQFGGNSMLPYNNASTSSTYHSGVRDSQRSSYRSSRRDSRRSRSRSPTPNMSKPLLPSKSYIEPVEEATSMEHNDYLMDLHWDFQMAIDQARFSKLLIPSDLKTRDLAVKLYEAS